MSRFPAGGRRHAALWIALGLAVSSCSAADSAAPSVSIASVPAAVVADVSDLRVQGPRPGPVKPFRGEMRQHIRIVDGYISMYFELDNIGEEPVTFLNTLYDYEPDQLYTPAVRLEWKEGGNVVHSRSGRFFPSPAILQPGETGAYLMGGQPVQGGGASLGDLVTHIKYCPTRGMNDVPSIPLAVADLDWEPAGELTTVRGTLMQESGAERPARPTIGVAFFAADGEFVGAVVQSAATESLERDAPMPFEMSGPGVIDEEIATARAWAWLD